MIVTHRPVGPCYLITPWNFPLAMATRKLGSGPCCRLHSGDQTCHPNSPDDTGARRAP
jgi:hypothetical protein